jgi:hypothetical protein
MPTGMYHPQGHAQGLNVLGMDHHATAGDITYVRQNIQKDKMSEETNDRRDKTSRRLYVRGDNTPGRTKRLETKHPFGLFSVNIFVYISKTILT